MVAIEDYREWTQEPLADPRRATAEQLVAGMELIVAAEGPVMASRVFNLYARAGGLSRIYDDTRQSFVRALQTAIRDGVFLIEKEDPDDPGSWILRLGDQKFLCLRTLGSRSLHEVPFSELAELMLEIRVRDEMISREELFRELLSHYSLSRLTDATGKRLDHVLTNWF